MQLRVIATFFLVFVIGILAHPSLVDVIQRSVIDTPAPSLQPRTPSNESSSAKPLPAADSALRKGGGAHGSGGHSSSSGSSGASSSKGGKSSSGSSSSHSSDGTARAVASPYVTLGICFMVPLLQQIYLYYTAF
ncbi:hypothetical protein H4R33_003142 [Dimargaris cristalligena]|uniref:Uncharacterized protein n=1 Tax=Dimargaris cristalligena TaxID=215637 RepID=A0A4P9ZZ10_9FUNG|nr:hypothetical protein H4R33_003142 [Dimargaris cristalligena]RKP38030.1 hypothetical protein BJ085DRAFT_39971 [Dimargaris cristalligena]|eukprot:RKP38030.1 hypothetical protein BJ085DRAFT_39971 [Dimargaris cristalligena]